MRHGEAVVYDLRGQEKIMLAGRRKTHTYEVHAILWLSTKRNRAIRHIRRLRASIYRLETPAVIGERTPTSAWINCFGARHYQPHIKLLRPGSGIERDLTKLREIFRSDMEWIDFDRF